MADRELRFATTLVPDEPLRQSAGYVFGQVDRQQIDAQILALQGFAQRALLTGIHATYVRMLGAGAKGDVVCSTTPSNGVARVAVAATDALTAAGAVMGVLLEAVADGGNALVALAGLIAPDVTGLAVSAAGWVRVTSAGRCEKVTTVAATDTILGYVDAGGFLRLGAARPVAVVGVTDQPFVLDAGTVPAALPNARAGRALTATLDLASSTVTPLSTTRTGAAGASLEGFATRRLITGGAAGTTGTSNEWAFYLPDSTPSQRRSTRLRSEWTSPTALNPRAKLVISLLSTDGEHDRVTIADTGAVRFHTMGAGVVRSDAQGNLANGQVFNADFGEAYRLAYGVALLGRNEADNANLSLLALQTSTETSDENTLVLGNDILAGGLEYRTGADVQHTFFVDTSPVLTLSATQATVSAPLKMATYTVATLPDPADYQDCTVAVSNDAGGRTLAYSNGTNWLRVRDNVVVAA